MPRKAKPVRPNSSDFYDGRGVRWHVSAQFQEDGSVYLYVPRDGRYWLWHKAYWNGVPEWAREKDLATLLHWVDSSFAESAASVLKAYYPEAVFIRY